MVKKEDRERVEEFIKHREKEEKVRQLVVKDNDIIQKTKFSLTAIEQKLICYIISLIKPSDEVFSRYTISIKDFAELCGSKNKNIYDDFKKMIDELDKKALWITYNDVTFKFRWFSEAEYNDKKGTITVMLNSRIKQHLLQLKTNFTKYELWNILALKSKWSIRLYELFKSYEYQRRIVFDLEELKSLLGAEDYKAFGNFKQRVLEKAKKDIDLYTDITVNYKVERKGIGGKVKSIIFNIDIKENFEGFLAYRNTINAIEKRNKDYTKGQMRINIDGTITEEGII